MSSLVNVARYHLVDRFSFTVLPISITAASFVINLVILALTPGGPGPQYTGGLFTLCVGILILGSVSVSRFLPFGFALGLSRRTYYLGAIVFAAVLALAYGLGVAVLHVVENAASGWGIDMYFFNIPWILDGSWYLTLLTMFVVLVLMFTYGMWYGLVLRRWRLTGVVVFAIIQAFLALLFVAVATLTDSWPAIGTFFAELSTIAFTGILAALAAVFMLGSYATIRRITI